MAALTKNAISVTGRESKTDQNLGSQVLYQSNNKYFQKFKNGRLDQKLL